MTDGQTDNSDFMEGCLTSISHPTTRYIEHEHKNNGAGVLIHPKMLKNSIIKTYFLLEFLLKYKVNFPD